MDENELYETIHSAVSEALAQRPKKEQKNHVIEAATTLFCIWLGIAVVDYFSYAPWVNRFRYSVWYSVDNSQVIQTQKKSPSDCDFLEAPIGHKGCHYAKTVTYEHVITGHDTNTNRPIVSYDEGKTWAWNDGEYPISPSATVYVGWQKIEKD